jgi:muramidase (phage lysozyme)
MTREEKALLDMLSFAEGTLGVSNNGYDVVVGSKRVIAGWTKDTTIVHGGSAWLDKANNSTAAGRYQFLYSSWVGNSKVNKPMTAANQDARALEIIDSVAGNVDKSKMPNDRNEFNKMIQKLCVQWASLPVVTTVTDKKGKVHKAGLSYYNSDGVNHTKYSIDKLYEIFKLAHSKY